MSRRSIIRILLSLLLLSAQQMAMSHVMGHWAAALGGPTIDTRQADERGLSQAIAQDHSCNQCLAFAQLAGAVGSPAHWYVPAAAGSSDLSSLAVRPGHARTACAFQPRGPPVLF